MSTTLQLPKTLQEAVSYFSNPQRTFEYAVKLRWPDGKVICPRCNSTEHSFISTRRIWFCKDCKKQFTVKVGTILTVNCFLQSLQNQMRRVEINECSVELQRGQMTLPSGQRSFTAYSNVR